MTKRVLLWLMTIALLLVSAVPVWAKPAPSPSPNVPAKAGNITALLPVVHLVRGSGKTAITTDAKKGDELVWNDLVKTEKGGRARVTLSDQSILSLGSQAELRIVKHDPRAQQTAIQMAYGRVRAQVANITRDGGSFELRTPTAVAGVIGTDFGVDSSATGGDTFICLAGATQVSNGDPNVPGSVQCSAGQTTTVQPGKSPTAPTPASLQQLQQLIEDTEPAIISSISPAAALPGTNFDSNISGSKMGKVTTVTVAGGTGVSATIKSANETSVQIHVVVDPTAPAGPRTLTLVKEAGASSATVFTVLGTPIGDPKKAYLDTLDQLKTTGVGGLSAFLTGAQQAADQVAQQITQANQNLPKPLDLSPFANSLNQQYGVLSNDLKGGTGSIDKAAQDAATTFAGLYDSAFQALLQRDPTGTPDTTFKNALTAAFTQANAILQTALQATQTGLNGAVQTYGNQLNTIQQTWSQNINTAFIDQQAGPLPKVNALERIVEQGAVTSFDAASSSASNASISITSYQWTLCAANYQPSGFGQMLPTGAAACNGIQGFVSASSEFQIATCSLPSGSYFARLSVTDSNNKISQMDVKLTVLQPNYPTPGGTVRALADSYTSLQLSQFLRLFDSAQFNGYTPLSENIRQTMQSLSSMAINLRLSQENVTCNDATVRADWQQNYSFISNPKAVFNQSEQLSVRLQRTPGAGWFITDFQGDNGKVQGVPGPQTVDTAAPDLEISSTTIDGRPVSSAAPLQVSAGPHAVAVNIANNGTASLEGTGSLPVIITLQDTNGTTVTTIDTFNGVVPSPLPSGSFATVNATLNFPVTATNLSLQVQVNPTCNPPEKTCGAPNNSSYPVSLGLPDFTATFIPTTTVNGIAGRSFSLAAVNVTPSPYPVALNVVYTGLPAGLAAGSPPGNTTNINGALIAGTPGATGSSTVTASATAAGNTKTLVGSVAISIGSEITVTPTSSPSFITGGTAQNLTLNVAGGVYPVTIALTLPTGFTTTSGTVTAGVSRQVITGPGAVTYALSAGVTSGLGNQSFTVVATDPGIPASNTPAGNKTFLATYSVTGLPDLQVGNVQIPPALQMGAADVAQIPVTNSGPAAAAAGWDVVITINGAQAGSAIGPAIPAGQTVTVNVPLNIPQIGNPPVSTTVPGSIALNNNKAIQEISTTNNTFNANLTLTDFTLTLVQTATLRGVVGRTFNLLTVNVAPTPYLNQVNVLYSTLPPGLFASTTNNPNGLVGERIVGTPTAPTGTVAITVSGNSDNVVHAAPGTFSLVISPEITITEPTPPSLASGGAAQNLTVNVTGGVFPVTLALSLPTGITTTSGTVNAGVSTQTITGPGAVTWALSADFTAALGSLNTNIVATDGGAIITGTPAGGVTFSAGYAVTGNSSYATTGLVVTGHNSPYTGADAFQVGEVTTFTATVKNMGNTSPTGTVTITLDCGNPAICQTPLTGSAAAPAAGASVTIPISVDFPNFTVATYNGTATLSTNVSGAQVGGPFAIPFDIVDFTIANASQTPAQNLPVGGSATLGVSLTEQRPSGNPFNIPITAAPTDSALVFTPVTQPGPGAFIGFPLTIGASAVQGQGTVRFNATNRGVTKFVDVPYVAFTANMTSTTLFVNDFADPLLVPVAVGAQAPPRYPTVGLKMNGNFDHSNGSATLNVPQPGCGNFTATLLPPTAVPSDVVDLPIFAGAGNTCPAGTQLVINASIPQTFPTAVVPVYTLFVMPAGLPLLKIQSATPPRDLSTQPWLSGEPLDWTVVVQNTGSGTSSGNEKVTIYAGAAEVGQSSLGASIPVGQTGTVIVHTVAPDFPESNTNVGSFINVRASVQNDNQGDLNPGSGDSTFTVNFSNWGIAVLGNNGVSDTSPLDLSPTVPTNTADIGIKNQATFNPNISVSLVPGSFSTQLNAPGFSPNSITSASTSTVTVSYPTAASPTNGPYFVQVIAQMKDGGVVTAQRQATLHVRLTNQVNAFPAGITLASDRTNIGPPGCTSPTCQTIQINGPLPEAFTLTATVNSCSAGNGCPGTADISFTDSFLTVTTPQVSTVQVTSPGNTLPVRVKAGDNPDGSINVGSAKVNVSVNAVQASFFGSARTPTPDPVGTQFDMNFSIGDLFIVAPSCVSIPPQDSSAIPVSFNWQISNGFNVPSVQWEWQDTNHIPVGGSPLSFSPANGSSTFTGNSYSPLPTFNLSNPTNGIDGLQTYYFAFTVSNSVATATKYFPVDVDLSRSQTFCPNLGANRGSNGGRLIRGSWGKAGLNAPSSLSAARTATGKLPDLRISSNDISFTPSVPKAGDKVEVRFRISNVGDADATGVPVALQVRGNTVASDMFDIPAGKTVLGGLNWTKADTGAGAVQTATQRSNTNVQARTVRPAKLGLDAAPADASSNAKGSGAGRFGLRAQIVIDPQKTITQKSTLAKSAALAHFDVRDTAADAATMASLGEQHALLILSDGACGGLKIASGAGSCSSTADLTFTVEDLAKGTYKLESNEGVADLGIGNTSYANASFGMQALLQSGRTYAVQTRGGSVGLVTIRAVRSPQQLSEAAKKLFRQGQAVTIVKSLGGSSDAPQTGDVAGKGSDALVYFDITYQGN